MRVHCSWPSFQPTLSDGVIDVRPWNIDDTDWLFDACRDPDIQRWSRVSVCFALEDAESFIQKWSSINWASARGAEFAVVDTLTGCGLGAVGFRVSDLDSGVGEAGFWTVPDARHKRIATRALRLLSDWVLNSCGFVRLELLIEVENEKSKATAANAGYRSNYEVKKEAWSDGARRDVVIYTRTA